MSSCIGSPGQARVTAEIQRAKARQRQNQRKRETRRKILMGAMLQDRIDRGKVPEKVVMADMDQFLTRDHERALFDLPPRQDNKKGTTQP